jgi:NAD(P)-dependent dehydrogenase (short-subunit alcohol dehydrogenase family)
MRSGRRVHKAVSEWAAAGVRVNSVAPGLIASSGFDNYSSEAASAIPGFTKTIPAQRYGTVAEVSAAIGFFYRPLRHSSLAPASAWMAVGLTRVVTGRVRRTGATCRSKAFIGKPCRICSNAVGEMRGFG